MKIDQPELPLRPYADRHVPRVKGSDTSTAAAQSQEPTLASKQQTILALISSNRWPDTETPIPYETRNDYLIVGWTDDDLERITGWRHQSVSARRRELVLAGLVVDSGERRKTSSGRMATVWKAAP